MVARKDFQALSGHDVVASLSILVLRSFTQICSMGKRAMWHRDASFSEPLSIDRHRKLIIPNHQRRV